ncbi:MAG: pilus assembly protein PilM [Acidobacteria bacterium]|nr:pilus assembly protein PilM [Acidobacteriota bacterium]
MKTSWLAAPPPPVAIEIASRRVTVASVAESGGTLAIRGLAIEALPEGVVTPALTGPNLPGRDVVATAVGRALQRGGLGGTKRAALIVPDSVARVSLLPLATIPARASDLDRIVRWQLRKTTPFPLDQAQVTCFTASRGVEATTIAAVVARRDVIMEYEAVTSSLGIHAGTVDLASFNVMNAAIASSGSAGTDSLLVHASTEATTLAILRGGELMFYRHRTAVEDEPLGALVHQTAMYHEDRLGGGRFARVWVAGDGLRPEVRDEISRRLGVDAQIVDVRPAIALPDHGAVSSDVLDALAAPAGMLLRDRKAA